jgi:hypothetical protein
MSDLPIEAQPLEHGVIRWDLPLTVRPLSGRMKKHVTVTCGDCGEDRSVFIHELRRANRIPSGRCKECSSVESRKHLKHETRQNHTRYTGGVWFDKTHGYRHIAVYPGDPWYEEMGAYRNRGEVRYIAEHRLVMANHLERALRSWEHVHHLNRDKIDNRLENLELVNGSVHAVITALESEVDRLQAEVLRLERRLGDALETQAA